MKQLLAFLISSFLVASALHAQTPAVYPLHNGDKWHHDKEIQLSVH